MGVSLDLLRAIALADTGRAVEADALARRAIAARPYPVAVQLAGTTILQALRPIGTPSLSPYAGLVAIEPDAAVTAPSRRPRSAALQPYVRFIPHCRSPGPTSRSRRSLSSPSRPR